MAKEHTDKVIDVYLDKQSMEDYLVYGTSTIEDRAIVGTFDGLKPVMRRAMWAVHKLGANSRATKQIKGALMVGETMGKYHPHGDSSIYEAMVNATQLPFPLLDGTQTNWGTMTTGAAAPRYTESQLTKYADLVFFDEFYLPMMQMGPNYDDSLREPVNLNTLLPNGILNGNFGICPGVNTRTPAFTLKSVVTVLKAVLSKHMGVAPSKGADGFDTARSKVLVEVCKDLEWISDYGGKLAKSSHNKAQVKQFYKTGVGSVDWESSYTLDEKLNAIRYTRFAPFSTNDKAKQGEKSPIEKMLSAIGGIPGVAYIDDDSDKKDPFRQAYMVRFVKTLKGEKRDQAINKVNAQFMSRQRMAVMVTDRTLDVKNDKIVAKLRPITVPQLIHEWCVTRIALEQNACGYWIEQVDKDIRWNEVMRMAIAQLKFIFATVANEKLSDEQVVSTIAKGLKITVEEADRVVHRNLLQLRKLEDNKLMQKIKELTARKKTLVGRRDKPAAYIQTHLDHLVKELT